MNNVQNINIHNCTQFCSENVKEKQQLDDLGVDILKFARPVAGFLKALISQLGDY
jgi:hypothetical protein